MANRRSSSTPRASGKSAASQQSRAPLIESESISSQNARRSSLRTPRKAANSGYKEKENESDAGSNSSASAIHLTVALYRGGSSKKSFGSGERPSRFTSIRSPDHWLQYPQIIRGAVDEVTSKINSDDLRTKVSATLTDVMNTEKKNVATSRNYLAKARTLLTEYLGIDGLDANLANQIGPKTSFDQLVRISERRGANSNNNAFEQEEEDESGDEDEEGEEEDSHQNVPKNEDSYREDDDDDDDEGDSGGTPSSIATNKTKKRNIPSKTVIRKSSSYYKTAANDEDSSFKTPTLPPSKSATKRSASMSAANSNSAEKRQCMTPTNAAIPTPTTMTPLPGDPRRAVYRNLQQQQQGSGSSSNSSQKTPVYRDKSVMVVSSSSSQQQSPILRCMPGGPMQLLTAPQRERQRFRGTPDELREEIRRVLTGNYAGNVDDMVEVLSEAVLKEHRMAKLLKARRIPFDLMLASFNFCSRFLALETVEIVDDEPEPQPPAASNAAESEKKKNGGKEGEGSEPVCNGTAAAKHVSSSNNGGGNEEEEAMED